MNAKNEEFLWSHVFLESHYEYEIVVEKIEKNSSKYAAYVYELTFIPYRNDDEDEDDEDGEYERVTNTPCETAVFWVEQSLEKKFQNFVEMGADELSKFNFFHEVIEEYGSIHHKAPSIIWKDFEESVFSWRSSPYSTFKKFFCKRHKRHQKYVENV